MGIKLKREVQNADILVVTPLLHGHTISKKTRTTIKRNQTPFSWVIVSENNNIPTNVELGLNWYRKEIGTPKYVLPIDRDIIMGRNMIDKMYHTLEHVRQSNVAYTYANFEFKGTTNAQFPARPFDIAQLVTHNYISSNSMIKVSCLDKVGGFIKDDKYVRLLDWCLWLTFLYHGYIGFPTYKASFVAISEKDTISDGGDMDYTIKRNHVIKDFIEPLHKKYSKEE